MPQEDFDAWYESVYKTHYPIQKRHLTGLCNSYNTSLMQDVEEILEDVFLQVWKRREKLYAYEYLSAWLYRASTNRFFDYARKASVRKRKHAGSLDDPDAPNVQLPSKTAAERILEERMADIVDCVGEEQYSLLLHYYDPRLSNDTLAASMGISPTALRKRVSRIIGTLRTMDARIFFILFVSQFLLEARYSRWR